STVSQFEDELAKSNEVIQQCYPHRSRERLISYARPGGVPWHLSDQQEELSLRKFNLVARPSFQGPPFHLNSLKQMLAYVDQTVTGGDFGHLDFHGVGGDWHAASAADFTALLDKLDSLRDQL